eukprot:7391511-Prymnesium_polylepis.1
MVRLRQKAVEPFSSTPRSNSCGTRASSPRTWSSKRPSQFRSVTFSQSESLQKGLLEFPPLTFVSRVLERGGKDLRVLDVVDSCHLIAYDAVARKERLLPPFASPRAAQARVEHGQDGALALSCTGLDDGCDRRRARLDDQASAVRHFGLARGCAQGGPGRRTCTVVPRTNVSTVPHTRPARVPCSRASSR